MTAPPDIASPDIAPLVIDDMTAPAPQTPLGTAWELVTDGVMGGLSRGQLRSGIVNGRPALRMTGAVSLANNGGFVQMALDLAPVSARGDVLVDARGWSGISLTVCGPAETYNLHLRTRDITRPWQSYRQSFDVTPDWTTVNLPFARFEPHRIAAPLDAGHLRRIGIVAIGRAFQADLALADLRYYA